MSDNFTAGKFRAFDADGNPLSGGKLYSYDAGTTTPKNTYTNAGGLTANANPVILDADGYANVWLTGNYKMKLTDADDVEIWTVDDIVDYRSLIEAATAVSEDAAATVKISSNDGTFGRLNDKVTVTAPVVKAIANPSGAEALNLSVTIADNTTALAGTSNVTLMSPLRVQEKLDNYNVGHVIDRQYAEYASNADLSVAVPYDDTIPQVTEGTEIISVSFTPKSATNRLRFRFQGDVSASASVQATVALFENGGSNAIAAATIETSGTSTSTRALVLEFEYVPGVTTATTYSLRAGGSSGTLRFNGTTAARRLGGVMKSTLVIEEIKQ